ncbi:MAG: translation elongation factor 4 [Patescibacteria group bacterium]|nr:translation elongation factor 4 [Patescibacteria group bacterium]
MAYCNKNIRNFSIIAHIDSGKSTLADRLLELTGTIPKEKIRPQYLDAMDLEQERGITIKMHPVRMTYNLNLKTYILNLIDTPGHVDFNYEVSRSLAAVEGAILLIDASQGIQAQTIANLELAKKQNLVIIPVINKIDLSQARVKETEREIADLLKIDPTEIIKISAKSGANVEQVLQTIIRKIPPPFTLDVTRKDLVTLRTLRALIFDSKYDPYQGVLAFVRIFEGEVKSGDKIHFLQAGFQSEVKSVGIFKPELSPVAKLSSGEIGFIATGIKESAKVRVGETLASNPEVKPLAGYRQPQPKVFLSIYPENANDFELLKSGLEKLKLNDASLYFKPELKEGLGRGFQCGFLGLLHAEIISERLKREFGLNIVLTIPSVIYKVTTKDNKEIFIHTAADWPAPYQLADGKFQSQELWVKLKILTPLNYLGQVSELIKGMASSYQKTDYLGQEKIELVYEVPLREIITKNFYDKLQSATQGFASMSYEILNWRPAELIKLDILILGKKEEAFSRIVPAKEAFKEGKQIIQKLKETLPPQLFSVPLQAAVGGKIIARETIKARRRDVLAPLYGGDYTRKRKLLEKQKKGKRDLAAKGKIRIPSRVFLEIFTR